MVVGVQLSMGSRCVKYLMFIFNLLFVISGILLISLGSVIFAIFHEYRHFLDKEFLSVPSLLIAIGVIIFLIAFFGCCGAVRENYCMLFTFATLMILVFILELAGGISGYVLRAQASDIVTEKMNSSMAEYKDNTEITFLWDGIQKKLRCCGTNEPKDWQLYFANDSLPMTCCDPQAGAAGTVSCKLNSTSELHVHDVGCAPAFLDFVKVHALQLGGVGFGVAFLQFAGIWFAISLAKSIRNTYESV
ncbi:CD63 antigen-like [Neodiprion fabricii]|uniref:CD63 antigen-like n=1 Tax=Neodiprion fabricii TaxID=2872261 RepID=UPI001ED8C9A2|nr:CD63 antigen-like [Neodiprion fabricii]